MLKTLAALTVSLMVPAAVLADAPATQPAGQASTVADAKVLVASFQPVEPTDPDWIGRAVQQSLVADLSRSNTGTNVQPFADTSRVGSAIEAVDAGKRADARYVIFGSYQRIEPTLRITGQIVDVTSGKVVAGLKATGSDRDLFDMQDTLAFQAKWGLGTERLAQKSAVAKADAAAVATAPDIPALGPVRAGERYMDSDLSRAVADGRSLIERDDAAGQSFRREYYDEGVPAYPAGYYDGYYGWNGWWGAPYAWWWWGSRTTVIIKDGHCNNNPSHSSFNLGPNTMQFSNGNYIKPTDGNYIRPTGGNYIAPNPGNAMGSRGATMAPTRSTVAAPAPAPAPSAPMRPMGGGVRGARVK